MEPDDVHSCQSLVEQKPRSLWRQCLPIFAANREVTKGKTKPQVRKEIVLQIQAFWKCRIIRGKEKNERCLWTFFFPMHRDTRKKCFYSQTELITWKIKFVSVPPVATHSLYVSVQHSVSDEHAQMWGWLLNPCTCEAWDLTVTLVSEAGSELVMVGKPSEERWLDALYW